MALQYCVGFFISHFKIRLTLITLLHEFIKSQFDTYVCRCLGLRRLVSLQIWCDFDRASSLICGNKMSTRCNRGFYCVSYSCSTCFGHHYAHHQELKSIIRWLLPLLFRAVVFKLLVWCGAEGYQTSNLKITARNTTGSNHRIILLGSWWWA